MDVKRNKSMESKSTAVTELDLPERNLDQEVLKPLITGKFARPRCFCACICFFSLRLHACCCPVLGRRWEDLGLTPHLPSTLNVPWDESIHQTQVSAVKMPL